MGFEPKPGGPQPPVLPLHHGHKMQHKKDWPSPLLHAGVLNQVDHLVLPFLAMKRGVVSLPICLLGVP